MVYRHRRKQTQSYICKSVNDDNNFRSGELKKKSCFLLKYRTIHVHGSKDSSNEAFH